MKALFILALLCAQALVASASITPANDVFTACNDAATEATIHDSKNIGPGYPARRYAIVHVAQYNAWNSIARSYNFKLFSTLPQGPSTASPTAAAAQACRDALVFTDPDQVPRWDEFLQAQLALVQDGNIEQGIEVGKKAAAEVIKLRSNDGAAQGNKFWQPNLDNGCHWQPDPLSPGQSSWGYGWGNVDMWLGKPVEQWPFASPPELDSARFQDLYSEVYTMGEKNSKVRSKEQLEVGLWWAYDNKCLGFPNAIYNRHLQEIAYQRKNTVSQNAALFALANIAMADGCTAAWHYKFEYDLGRPITVIRNGCTGNPNNKHNPDWEPYGGTCGGTCNGNKVCSPPFAADPSGHATFGGAVYHAVKNFYGSDISFWGTSQEANAGPVRRDYKSLEDAAFENAQSRIYLGIHWGCDRDDGIRLGKYAADLTFKTLTGDEFGKVEFDSPLFPQEEKPPKAPRNAPNSPRNAPNSPNNNDNNDNNGNSSSASVVSLSYALVAAVSAIALVLFF